MVKSVIGWLGLKLKLHHSWTFSQPITTSFWTQGDLKLIFLTLITWFTHLTSLTPLLVSHSHSHSLSLNLSRSQFFFLLTLTASTLLLILMASASHLYFCVFVCVYVCVCVCVCVCIFPPLVALPLALTLCALCFGGFIRYWTSLTSFSFIWSFLSAFILIVFFFFFFL